MGSWYIERLPSGQYGLFAENGTRVGVHRTKEDAQRHRVRLTKSGRKRGKKGKGSV